MAAVLAPLLLMVIISWHDVQLDRSFEESPRRSVVSVGTEQEVDRVTGSDPAKQFVQGSHLHHVRRREIMTTYRLISPQQLAAFGDVLVRHGWKQGDFELQEDVFDPATAEVEAALGEVGVRCLKTQAVATYRLGTGLDWLANFEDDLRQGRMGGKEEAHD